MPETSPWHDLNAYVGTPRLGELTVGPNGALLVSVSSLDAKETAYQSALWQLDGTGGLPARRLTRSLEGESTAAYLSDGSLLFTSKRPVPTEGKNDEEDVTALWCLPAAGGEAYAVARRDGGWQGLTCARTGGRAVLSVGMHPGVADEQADAEKRALRRKRKVSAILHEAYPVRFWDEDLGRVETRLLAVDFEASRDGTSGDLSLVGADVVNLVPDAARKIGTTPSLALDGSLAVVDWKQPAAAGVTSSSVAAVDVETGAVTVIAAADEQWEFYGGVVSDDGSLVACVRERRSTARQAEDQKLWLAETATGVGRPLAGDWDAWPTPVALSPDASTVYATVDEDGHAPIYAVDVATGDRRRLTQHGAHTSVRLSFDGSILYAVRSSYTDPGSVIAINVNDGAITDVRIPMTYPGLPGRLENVDTHTDDGVLVRGYLLLPDASSDAAPAPLALWIHGGPLGSWNSWSWRWCPWLLVSRGYAVLLPDPALSTGYGQAFIQRGWGEWGAAPYTDLMAITDAVEARPDIDATHTVAMGGSFGGYMANWVAGHTDRFAAIVSHASLWNLETFGGTTDAAWFWSRELTPEAQRRNSPHRFADAISTPMLVIHGDKDYRVPISESLALWWALASHHQGPPQDLPHKFLYYPDESHWVLTPQHALVWYETVLAFLETHVRGGNFERPQTL